MRSDPLDGGTLERGGLAPQLCTKSQIPPASAAWSFNFPLLSSFFRF